MTAPKTIAPPTKSHLGESVVVWQSLAVIALVAMVVGVAASSATDLCSSTGPVVLLLTWLVAPVVAIAAIATVAVIADQRLERIVAASFGIGLTGSWLLALQWASVGEAVQRSAC